METIRYRWTWFKHDYLNSDKYLLRLARLLPKRLVMWCYIVVLTDGPDPDVGTRDNIKPLDAMDQWARHHGLY